jgi:hypothetical protein
MMENQVLTQTVENRKKGMGCRYIHMYINGWLLPASTATISAETLSAKLTRNRPNNLHDNKWMIVNLFKRVKTFLSQIQSFLPSK